MPSRKFFNFQLTQEAGKNVVRFQISQIDENPEPGSAPSASVYFLSEQEIDSLTRSVLDIHSKLAEIDLISGINSAEIEKPRRHS